MPAMSDFLEAALIGHLFRGAAYAAPATLHVGLLTAAPTDGTPGTEVAGSGYARAAVANSAAQWSAIVGNNGTTSNASVVSMPTPSANWGLVTHFAIYDAASAGNMLWYAPLTVAKTVNTGDAISFPVGSITVQIDN